MFGGIHMKKYFIIGKKGLCLLVAICVLIAGFSILGVRKIAVDVMAGMKVLPIYSVETKNQEKKASLGINCAWENSDIPQILDTLDTYQVKATFFLVGDWCDKYPDSVKAIFDRGHEIGNHSDSHPDMPSLTVEEMKQEIEGCSNKIQAITGTKPTLFRCPSGAYSDDVINTATSLGYSSIQWDCDSIDWKDPTPEQMQQRIMKNLQSGSIMLFHNDTKYTAAALPQIIKAIQDEGYQLVPVGELIYQENYTIDHSGRQIPNQQ